MQAKAYHHHYVFVICWAIARPAAFYTLRRKGANQNPFVPYLEPSRKRVRKKVCVRAQKMLKGSTMNLEKYKVDFCGHMEPLWNLYGFQIRAKYRTP